MSMFKSLQNLPSSITVFHSAKSPISSQLVSILQKNSIAKAAPAQSKSFFQRLTSPSTSDRPSLYQLDITESLPTKEQYASIRDSISANTQNKDSFIKAFPKFDLHEGNFALLPSVSDYLKLENETDEGFFKHPLVVDWDHGLLATDAEGVKKIIEVFQNPNEEESST